MLKDKLCIIENYQEDILLTLLTFYFILPEYVLEPEHKDGIMAFLIKNKIWAKQEVDWMEIDKKIQKKNSIKTGDFLERTFSMH